VGLKAGGAGENESAVIAQQLQRRIGHESYAAIYK